MMRYLAWLDQSGLREHFAGYAAGIASGLSLRHDHGSQYLSDHFQGELSFLGIRSSPSFVAAPEGNGCAERFIRTLKEQLLWVETFETVEQLRLALLAFKDRYNQAWLVERHDHQAWVKLSHRTRWRRGAPAAVRQALLPSTGAARPGHDYRSGSEVPMVIQETRSGTSSTRSESPNCANACAERASQRGEEKSNVEHDGRASRSSGIMAVVPSAWAGSVIALPRAVERGAWAELLPEMVTQISPGPIPICANGTNVL